MKWFGGRLQGRLAFVHDVLYVILFAHVASFIVVVLLW